MTAASNDDNDWGRGEEATRAALRLLDAAGGLIGLGSLALLLLLAG